MDPSSPSNSPTAPLTPYPDIPIQSPNMRDGSSRLPSNYPPIPSSLPPNRHRIRQPYSTYSESSMLAAMEAITTTGLSLRKASQKYSVPKTTLAERLGDRRPRHQPINKDPNRPTVTRYAYSEADMLSALEDVRRGVSVSEAAKKYGVPSSSLGARVKGRTPKVLRGGERASKLTLAEESTLAEWAGALGRLGFPPGKDEVFALAERVVAKQGADRRLGKQWIGHWMRRHPEIEILDWEKPKRPEKEKGAMDRQGEEHIGELFEIENGK